MHKALTSTIPNDQVESSIWCTWLFQWKIRSKNNGYFCPGRKLWDLESILSLRQETWGAEAFLGGEPYRQSWGTGKIRERNWECVAVRSRAWLCSDFWEAQRMTLKDGEADMLTIWSSLSCWLWSSQAGYYLSGYLTALGYGWEGSCIVVDHSLGNQSSHGICLRWAFSVWGSLVIKGLSTKLSRSEVDWAALTM